MFSFVNGAASPFYRGVFRCPFLLDAPRLAATSKFEKALQAAAITRQILHLCFGGSGCGFNQFGF
jgi:hypothetical protein